MRPASTAGSARLVELDDHDGRMRQAAAQVRDVPGDRLPQRLSEVPRWHPGRAGLAPLCAAPPRRPWSTGRPPGTSPDRRSRRRPPPARRGPRAGRTRPDASAARPHRLPASPPAWSPARDATRPAPACLRCGRPCRRPDRVPAAPPRGRIPAAPRRRCARPRSPRCPAANPPRSPPTAPQGNGHAATTRCVAATVAEPEHARSVVQDDGLPRRESADRLVEVHEHPVVHEPGPSRHRRTVRTDLRGHHRRLRAQGATGPHRPDALDRVDVEELRAAHADGARADVHVDDVPRGAVGGRDPQVESASLADRERVGAVVPRHHRHRCPRR